MKKNNNNNLLQEIFRLKCYLFLLIVDRLFQEYVTNLQKAIKGNQWQKSLAEVLSYRTLEWAVRKAGLKIGCGIKKINITNIRKCTRVVNYS